MTGHDIEIWKLGFEGLKSFAVIAGAGWAIWRFRRERTHASQVAFSIDAKLHGPSNGIYVAEYILTFENKGRTRVQINTMELRVRGIKKNVTPMIWKKMPPRVEFTEKLIDDKYVIPQGYGHTYAEPGIRQEYRYISAVSEEIALLLVRGQFLYKADHSHSAERVIAVGAEAA